MLTEANLPVQFWFHCLTAMVHVLNRSPTAALTGKTPHEAWHKKKPDVSHLRVWGCLAYVHTQKDKRTSFGPHMEKCIFVGYPAGYKGWEFYNPVTRKFIISERAEFDERYFPGIKPTIMKAIPIPPSFTPSEGRSMPDLGGHDIPRNQTQTPVITPSTVRMPIVTVHCSSIYLLTTMWGMDSILAQNPAILIVFWHGLCALPKGI